MSEADRTELLQGTLDLLVLKTLATIDRAYILTEGSLLASGSSAEVAANPRAHSARLRVLRKADA